MGNRHAGGNEDKLDVAWIKISITGSWPFYLATPPCKSKDNPREQEWRRNLFEFLLGTRGGGECKAAVSSLIEGKPYFHFGLYGLWGELFRGCWWGRKGWPSLEGRSTLRAAWNGVTWPLRAVFNTAFIVGGIFDERVGLWVEVLELWVSQSSDLTDLSTESFNNQEVLELRNSFSGTVGLTLIGFWTFHIILSLSKVSNSANNYWEYFLVPIKETQVK